MLALILEEPGAEVVETLSENAALSAVNWVEVWQAARDVGVRVADLRPRVEEYAISIVPFTVAEAERAGDLHGQTRAAGLSLADRACLALASRLGVPAVTADRVWTTLDVDVEVVCIR